MTTLDTTFLLPVRIDNIERLENIIGVTNYLTKILNPSIAVLECSSYNNGLLKKLLSKNISYTFLLDDDPIFYRTKYINQMVRATTTPNIAIWDADVIAPKCQIASALKLLRQKEADFVFPYERYFLDTSTILRKLFLMAEEIEVLVHNAQKMREMYMPNPVGGAFFVRKEAYVKAGLENENFYGWGPEDHERYHRLDNAGCKIMRIQGALFHLSHGRGVNSRYQNADQYNLKFKEIAKVKRCSN
ncbi:galactosyltransferase-related protein [Mangrovibacterium marinum]|uniref:galactosyltransferase-related protein n=1 Tax=Mangrovibacterium marinum TaxID=1639118 RepID=UPI002A188F38|nr:galactosyltransferase-related protein [Mangrovibacterium marinum]